MLSKMSKYPAALLLSATFLSPLLVTGCRDRETVYYNRWERETHREHVELARRNAEEQKEYREWRDRQDHR